MVDQRNEGGVPLSKRWSRWLRRRSPFYSAWRELSLEEDAGPTSLLASLNRFSSEFVRLERPWRVVRHDEESEAAGRDERLSNWILELDPYRPIVPAEAIRTLEAPYLLAQVIRRYAQQVGRPPGPGSVRGRPLRTRIRGLLSSYQTGFTFALVCFFAFLTLSGRISQSWTPMSIMVAILAVASPPIVAAVKQGGWPWAPRSEWTHVLDHRFRPLLFDLWQQECGDHPLDERFVRQPSASESRCSNPHELWFYAMLELPISDPTGYSSSGL